MSQPTLLSFNGGELSPLLESRSDLEKYKSGCSTLQNMIPLTQGAVTRRVGTKYVGEVKDGANKIRLITFSRSEEISYILELGDHYIRVYHNGVLVEVTVADLDAYSNTASYIQGDWVQSGGDAYYAIKAGINHPLSDTTYWKQQDIYEVWTPYSASEVSELKFVQSIDVMYIVHKNHEVHKLSSTSERDFTLEKVDFTYQALKDENIDVKKTISITAATAVNADSWVANLNYPKDAVVYSSVAATWYEAKYNISEYEEYGDPSTYAAGWNALSAAPTIFPKGSLASLRAMGTVTKFTPDDVGKYIMVKKPRDDNSLSTKLNAISPAAGGQTDSMPVYGDWNMTSHGIWTATIEIQRSFDGGTTWVMHRTYSGTDDRNVEVSGTEEQEGVLYRVAMTARSSGAATVDLNVEDAYNKYIYKIVKYNSSVHMLVQILQDEEIPIGVVDIGHMWAWGAWGSDFGYPESIAMFEERLCFGGNANQPMTVWTSKSADYENLTSGVLDTDAIIYTFSSDKVNQIRWMIGQDYLLVGSSGDEWKLGANKTDEPMSPTNIKGKRQSGNGSENIQALLINDAVFYIQRGGRKLMQMGYDYQSELFMSDDVTTISEHITAPSIIDIQFQSTPFPILWCLRSDGVLVGFTYERAQKVFAWHKHITLGTIESIAVLPDGNDDRLWIEVQRELGTSGTYRRLIEQFANMKIIDDIADAWYVDSAITYKAPAAVDLSGGLTNVNPLTFSITGHGFSNGDKVRLLPTIGNTSDVYYEVYTISDVVGDVFKVKSEDASGYIDATTTSSAFTAGSFRIVKNGFTNNELLHLDKNDVYVIGDNTLDGTHTVASGNISFNDYYSEVLTGLPYTSIIETMNLESELADGGSQGRNKRVSEVVLRFYNTVGSSLVNGDWEMVIPFRTVSNLMGEAPPLYSGYKKIKYKGGYDKEQKINIQQDVPLPMTLLMAQYNIRNYN